jgi:hypothetical protein
MTEQRRPARIVSADDVGASRAVYPHPRSTARETVAADSLIPLGEEFALQPISCVAANLNRREGRFSARGIDLALGRWWGDSRPRKTLQ